jgi:predicted RecB family nuclease
MRIGDYEVVGAEQFVYLHEPLVKTPRRSPIDLLVFNFKTHEYEIWDFKFTNVPLKYKREPGQKNEHQVNLYAWAFMRNNSLKYRPIYRIIFIAKDDWSEILSFDGRADDLMAEQSLNRMNLVENNRRTNPEKLAAAEYKKFCTGLDVWADTKKRQREECRYCDFRVQCAQKLLCAEDDLLDKENI